MYSKKQFVDNFDLKNIKHSSQLLSFNKLKTKYFISN